MGRGNRERGWIWASASGGGYPGFFGQNIEKSKELIKGKIFN
jgi:hypothetical protein